MDRLNGEIVIITGGSGLLGQQYCKAIKDLGGSPYVLDLVMPAGPYAYDICDITDEAQIQSVAAKLQRVGLTIYGLINNAAMDPKVRGTSLECQETRLGSFPRHFWEKDMVVGLTGAFLCTKHFGQIMADSGRGSIINISSVLGLVAPNQALYRQEGLPDEQQPVKPVSYSVVKHGIIGLSRYTATYWASRGVRCNAICPGGVYNGHSDTFVDKLAKYIPLGRMARVDEYNTLIQYLMSPSSSFVTGAVISADGGQTTW
jgi:NAD(P)-dependent dehydrogenase (short-subunit alcohol dehydrogenase family)